MLDPDKTDLYLGPPGTGKTTTLVKICTDALRAGLSPEDITYISFTKRAAYEAVNKIVETTGLDQNNFDNFRTLHSFCYRRLGLRQSDVLSGRTLYDFAESIGMPITGTMSDDGYVGTLSDGDRCLTAENIARTMCIPLRQYYDNSTLGLNWSILSFFDRSLKEYKRRTNKLDFNDMLEQYLQTGDAFKSKLLIVDEAQDLSQLQWRVVQKLARNADKVIVAGDDDQAIYEWAGADIRTFLTLPGRVTVLDQSFRVPKRVQSVALRVLHRVIHRREKMWRPRDDDGTFRTVSDAAQVDLNDGRETLILSRNSLFLRKLSRNLYEDGIVHEYRGKSTVPTDTMDAVKGWEALRAGKEIDADTARQVARMLPGHLADKLRGPGFVSFASLEGHIDAQTPWYEALSRMPVRERAHIRAARRSGVKVLRKPMVKLSTIHTVKGAEADRVVLLSDLAVRTAKDMPLNEDAENRVFYVGVTRARNELIVVAPSSKYSFRL